jgi:hypothetical protein
MYLTKMKQSHVESIGVATNGIRADSQPPLLRFNRVSSTKELVQCSTGYMLTRVCIQGYNKTALEGKADEDYKPQKTKPFS